MIGFLLNPTSVLYYDLAEKIIDLCKFPFSMFSQVIFPKSSRETNPIFLKKVLILYIVSSFIVVITLNICANYFITTFFGSEMADSVFILRILSLTIPIVVIGNIFGQQILVAMGHSKQFMIILIYSAVLYCMLILFLWFFRLYDLVYFTLVMVCTDLFVTLRNYWKLRELSLNTKH